jgi:hypothetical protein
METSWEALEVRMIAGVLASQAALLYPFRMVLKLAWTIFE